MLLAIKYNNMLDEWLNDMLENVERYLDYVLSEYDMERDMEKEMHDLEKISYFWVVLCQTEHFNFIQLNLVVYIFIVNDLNDSWGGVVKGSGP